jgi:hypothetical protein
MKVIPILIAAFAAISLSACDKSIDEGVGMNEKALLSFSFSLPAHGDTRVAATDNADLSTIDIFVLDDNGNLEQTGGHTRFESPSDFTQAVAGDNVIYELKSQIETTSGTKRVYLGVNVPEKTFSGFHGGEKELLIKIHDLYRNERLSDESILFSDPLSIALAHDTIGSLAVNDDDFGIDYGDKVQIGIEVGVDPWNRKDVTVEL